MMLYFMSLFSQVSSTPFLEEGVGFTQQLAQWSVTVYF